MLLASSALAFAQPRPCGPPHPLIQPSDAAPLPGGPEKLSKGVPLFVQWEHYVPTYLCSLQDIFFVQIGIACGVNIPRCTTGGDPVWEYATQCQGWQGVAVEPSKKSMSELTSEWAYGSHRNVRPMHAAVGATDGETLVTSARGAGNFIMSKRAQDRRQRQPERQRVKGPAVEAVRTMSLRSLWADVSPPADKQLLLVVDAEGSEEDILTSGPIPSPRPRLILFEHAHLTQPARRRIDRHLRAQGYHLVAQLKHMDAVGIRHGPQDLLYGSNATVPCG